MAKGNIVTHLLDAAYRLTSLVDAAESRFSQIKAGSEPRGRKHE
jgi:hypothetical protein